MICHQVVKALEYKYAQEQQESDHFYLGKQIEKDLVREDDIVALPPL